MVCFTNRAGYERNVVETFSPADLPTLREGILRLARRAQKGKEFREHLATILDNSYLPETDNYLNNLLDDLGL